MLGFSLAEQDEMARDIQTRSAALWGEARATTFVGHHAGLTDTIQKVVRFGASTMPVLITGETGTGKELFARTLFLTSPHHRRVFASINCAQYITGDLLASELFGHKKGSFTGAVADRRGIFEEADGGTVFLDEVGELPLNAQSMLLRVLSEGEIIPVGSTQVRRVDVRIVAATSRDLEPMISAGLFRPDLYYRLSYLRVAVPPLRDRGNDWQLIAQSYLRHLGDVGGTYKSLSEEVLARLRGYSWPGNVREVKSLVETGYHLSEGEEITLADLGEGLVVQACDKYAEVGQGTQSAAGMCALMAGGEETFWDLVHAPYMDRDLNRTMVRSVIGLGLASSGGSYKQMVGLFGIESADYLKFMDFLRHHRLKPER